MQTLKIHIFVLLIAFAIAQKGPISINTGSRLMQDSARRSVIFHGVNIVYKVHPYIPQTDKFDPQLSLTDAEIDDLLKWGFNFVRLGVMWEAVERTPDTYNDTYLDEVEILINKLGAKGIYTLVDAHQDVFARKICGEGVPNFYASEELTKDYCEGGFLAWLSNLIGICRSIKSYGFRVDSDGNPLIEDCQKYNFALYYPTAESVNAFERLFTNKPDGLQDKFINYWMKVANRFANNPYIVGYDPINEPFPGNVFSDPSLIVVPGKHDRTYLQPLYKRSYDVYQKQDKSKIMFFEPTQFPDTLGIFGGFVMNLGFTEAPGGAQNADTQVLNDHTYCCQKSADMCSGNEPPIEKAEECLEWHQKRINTRTQDAQRYGVPLFISEFGACLNSTACIQEITSVGEVCDENLVGWAYWQLKNYADLTTSAGTQSEGVYNNDGTLQDGKVKALARTYLPATQGILTGMKFDTATANFQANFTVDTTISEPTVIYWSDYYYPQGFNLQVFDNSGTQLTFKADYDLDLSQNNYEKVKIINEKLNGQTLRLEITAKYI